MSQQEEDYEQSQKSSEKAVARVASSLLSADAAEVITPGPPLVASLVVSKKRQREQEPKQQVLISRDTLNKNRSVVAGTNSKTGIHPPQLDRFSGLDELRLERLVSGTAGRGLLADTVSARQDGWSHRSQLEEQRHLLGSGDMSQTNDRAEAAIRSSLASSGRINPVVADETESSSQRLQVLQQMVHDEERRLRIYLQQEMILRETLRSLEQESLRRRQMTLARDSVYGRRNRETELRRLFLPQDDGLFGSSSDPSSLQTHRPKRDTLVPQPFASYEDILSSIPDFAIGRSNPRDERLFDILSRSKEMKDRQILPEQQTARKDMRQDSGKSTRALALPSDKGVLSPYQSLIRESIQVFEAQPVDIDFFANSQGRNRKIELGQVGVRCQFCAHRPLHWCSRGAVYFPGSLSTIYQSAQNMAANHFLPGICEDMPDSIKEVFMVESQKKKERTVKRSAGKEYWECAGRSLGLEDREGRSGVWFCQSKER